MINLSTIFQSVVKQFTDIPINCGPFKEKNKTGSNFTVLVFLQYVISSIMYQKVWFSKLILAEINLKFHLKKDFQKRKLIIFFFFPPLAVLHVRHIIYPRTPMDTPRRIFTPQDALYMVRKSFILFYMINYHDVITFLVCITVFHTRTYKFYNSY